MGYVSSQKSCECGIWCGVWRDIRTVGSYAYIVSENEGHGIQVPRPSSPLSLSPISLPSPLTAHEEHTRPVAQVVDLTQLRGRKETILAYRRKLAGVSKNDRRRKLSPVKDEVAELFGTFKSPGKKNPESRKSVRHLLFGTAPVYDQCKPSTLEFTNDGFVTSDAHNIITFSVEDQAAGAPPVVITVGTDSHITAHSYNRGGNPQAAGGMDGATAADTVRGAA